MARSVRNASGRGSCITRAKVKISRRAYAISVATRNTEREVEYLYPRTPQMTARHGENGAIGAKRTLQIKKNKPANRHGKPPSQDGGFSVYYLLTPLTLPVSHICYTTPHEHKPRKEFWGVFIKLIN